MSDRRKRTSEEEAKPLSLERTLIRITVAGSLYMVFASCVSGPPFTDFLRSVGAREIHFGLLSGATQILVAMQFVGALLANRVRRRKPWFMALVIAGRALYLPIAVLPLIAGDRYSGAARTSILLMTMASAAMMTFTGPFWFSWMAEIIPHRILNRYWGQRQRWMNYVWLLTYPVVAILIRATGYPIRLLFPVLALFGVTAGVTDILLFLPIKEPLHSPEPLPSLRHELLAPLRDRVYRRFLTFSCVWAGAAQFSAAFQQYFVLHELRVPLWKTSLIWWAAGVGPALSSAAWGRLADRFGAKPVLQVCMAMKPLIIVVFLTITPGTVVWLLPIAFVFDSAWNAGTAVAQNGYMIKMSPHRNRPMFIAALAGITGLAGGLGALAGGIFLRALAGHHWWLFGREWTEYHALFLVNIVMRLLCLRLVWRLEEPQSAAPRELLQGVTTEWPLRVLLYPIELYRRLIG